ncbi:hypothetical protein [Treponema berlinense]|uniref:hypothetical protein n=1 Tax=Treponema berlinense TaxID=225004 RepID=UPI003F09A67E
MPLTISSKDGLVDQVTYFNKTVASKDMSGYYLLKNGEFAYNKSYSVGYDFGSIKRLDKYPMGALSTLYICFSIKNFDSDFMKVYFDSLKWYREIYLIAAEGARNHGLLNISTEDFFETKHKLPLGLPEQKKIAAFFTLLDRRIQKQRQLVERLKNYKRGVLQSVFSKNYKWEELSIEDIFSCIIDKNHPDKTVLTIVQGTGTLPRNSIDRKISYNAESVSSYKKVKENDFILHLRSFEGGLEIANEEGIVSPAYTILRATKNISPLFYYNYFRSYNFINEKLRIAVEGIRDGKSINMNTFWKIKVPFPHYELQNYYASFFSLIDKNIKKNESLLQALEKGKRQLLQKMFI